MCMIVSIFDLVHMANVQVVYCLLKMMSVYGSPARGVIMFMVWDMLNIDV